MISLLLGYFTQSDRCPVRLPGSKIKTAYVFFLNLLGNPVGKVDSFISHFLPFSTSLGSGFIKTCCCFSLRITEKKTMGIFAKFLLHNTSLPTRSFFRNSQVVTKRALRYAEP